MDEIKAKQQVIEKIKESAKILVTVSNDPSVDALSAALALTMILDKKEKYATAIFSGETPPAIAFLEPEKTFDDTTDSLRDFIIALNKEKADHLRYKVEGEAVKIFITPYKTTINESDLEFSQGDYNVELVIALGVDDQDHLDGALENHGKILHDASIITMTSGEQTSTLGGVDWHDDNASSLSEMVAGIAEALKEDKKGKLLDSTIATALLTGIVAETDRFSNEHTTARALTAAATLMSAGADQQLIANELQSARSIEVHTVDEPEEEPEADEPEKDEALEQALEDEPVKKDVGGLSIAHEAPVAVAGETLADLDRRVRKKKSKKPVEKTESMSEPTPAPVVEPVAEVAPVIAPAVAAIEPEIQAVEADDTIEPTLGGTLNATTDQAADDARREAENDQNRTILSHSYLGGSDAEAPGSVAVNETPSTVEDTLHSAYAFDEPTVTPDITPTERPQEAISGERVIQPLETSPYAAPEVAPIAPAEPQVVVEPVTAQEIAPAPTPVDLGLPMPPAVPDFSQFNAAPGMTPPPAIPLSGEPQPPILGDILAPDPNGVYAPAVDPSAIAPEAGTPYAAPEAPQTQLPPQLPEQPQQPESNDPGQFQIPGQQ